MTKNNGTGRAEHTNAAAATDENFRFYRPQSLWLAFMALNGTLKTAADDSLPPQSEQLQDIPQEHMAHVHRLILGNMNHLYRQRRLLMDHLRVLRFYGAKGRGPRHWVPREARAATLWAEALSILAPSWREMGFLKDDTAYLWDKAAAELDAEAVELPPAYQIDSPSQQHGGELWRR